MIRLGGVLVVAVAFIASSTLYAEERMLEKRLTEAFEAEELKGLHSVFILHKGEILVETYFPGLDQRWGLDIGVIDHNATRLHDLRSVTKSITGLLYGIALSEGMVPDLDAPLVDQFPEYTDLPDMPKRRKILVRHALSMTMGVEWDESAPYNSTRNSEIAMEYSEDRNRYALEQRIINEPGTHWTYSGGATTLIGTLISRGTGMPLEVFARQKLFDPLGIENYEWVKGRDGTVAGSSGLRMTTHDLAKIGQVMMNHGMWQGKQIVSAEWVEESITPRINIPDGLRYGYFWWLAGEGAPPYWYAGFGNGGQRLMMNPNNQMVAVIYAGNYNKPDAWKLPVKVLVDFVLPEIGAR